MKEPRVKEIIEAYKKGNIEYVRDYLTQNDMVVDPSTWAGYVKNLIDNKQYLTAKQTIELTGYKFLKL